MKIRLMMMVFAFSFLGWQMPARAAEMDMLACTPKAGAVRDGGFSLKAGELVLFTCTVTNPTGDNFSGMLLGKEFLGGQGQGASSSDVVLEKDGKSEASLQFPAIFVNGSYRFTFVVMDLKTKAVASKEVVLTGVLGGEEQPSIQSASIADGTYNWGDPFALTLTLALPSGKTVDNQVVTFDATMMDQHDQVCGTVVSDRAVTKMSDTYQLQFPKQGTCTNNALRITLKGTTGTVIDQKTLAINLPVAQTQATQAQSVANQSAVGGTSGSGLTIFMGAMIVTVVLVGVLFGYFVMKRRL